MNPTSEMPEEFVVVWGVILVVAAIGFIIWLAINAVICYMLSRFQQRIPEQYWHTTPASAWLLMIPCFNLIWNFIWFQKMGDTFKTAAASMGRSDLGDCGAQIYLWYCICCIAGLVPYVGLLAGIASLVLLIIALVKANEVSQQLQAGPQFQAGPDYGVGQPPPDFTPR